MQSINSFSHQTSPPETDESSKISAIFVRFKKKCFDLAKAFTEYMTTIFSHSHNALMAYFIN